MKKPKYKCRDCGWKDNTEYGMDKCPNCGGDDWQKLRPTKANAGKKGVR